MLMDMFGPSVLYTNFCVYSTSKGKYSSRLRL